MNVLRGVYMARNKYPEITVNRILEASLKLFAQKGYDNTTIQDIVDELKDLSKGAIYHHFKSKDEIMEAVIDNMYDNQSIFNDIKQNNLLNGLQKLKELLYLCISNEKQREVYELFFDASKNPKMVTKQLISTLEELAPILKTFIDEGIQDKSINLKNPKEVSEIISLLTNIWLNPIIFNMTYEEFDNKILFLKDLYEKLGLPIIDDRIIKALREIYNMTI